MENHPRPAITGRVSEVGTPWISSPGWDLVWISNSLWLAALCYAFEWTGASLSLLLFFAVSLGTAHNLGPFALTFTLPPLRSYALARKREFIVIPALIFLACFTLVGVGGLQMIGWAPRSAANTHDALIVVACIYSLLNTWHFGAQLYGVLSLYRARIADPDGIQRAIDRAYTFLTTCFVMPVVWLAIAAQHYRLFPFVKIGLLAQLSATTVRPLVIASTLPMLLIIARKIWLRRARGIPRTLALLNIGALPLIAFYARPEYYFFAHSVNHWLVELGLSSRILSEHYSRPAASRLLRTGLFLGTFFTILLLANLARSYCWKNSELCREHLLSGPLAISTPIDVLFIGIPIAFGISLTLCHFYLSGRIYRFSRADRRKLLLPLILGKAPQDSGTGRRSPREE